MPEPHAPLHRLDHLPSGFLDTSATDLHRVLDRPTLISLPGRRPDPLFVSILLHGNEDVGLVAVQQVLRRYAGGPLPRAMLVFIGNVRAAARGLRHLDSQPDFNRIWPGTPHSHLPEAALARALTEECRTRGLFASVDLHNNTGLNPHYACVSRLDARTLQLASLFGRTVVYFLSPPGTQTIAFSAFVPAITCECGKTGDAAGAVRAAELIEACLHLESLPDHAVAEGDVHLFRTVATVRPAPTASLSFDGSPADLRFVPDLDHFNFRELPAGTLLADTASRTHLIATNDGGRDVSAQFFVHADTRLRLARTCMPAMITRDQRVIRQDCLCYLMERMALPA